MSKIERVTSDLSQDARPLRDEELDAVNGGIIMVIRGLGGPDTHDRAFPQHIELLSYSFG
jgi:hypothetical protein